MAAAKIDLDPGYGFAEFTIGDVTTKPIDLYAAHDKYVAIYGKHTMPPSDDGKLVTDWDAVWKDWLTFLEEHGFPVGKMSSAAPAKVLEAIREAIEGLRKKDPQPAS